MKIAIVSEWVEKYGGGESVITAICEIFSEKPDILVLWNDSSDVIPTKESFIRFFNKLPKEITGLFSPIAHRVWKGRYNLVISTSHLFAHTSKIRGSKNAVYIAYVFTPARYIWETSIDSRGVPNKVRKILALPYKAIKYYDKTFTRHNDLHIAISSIVKERVKNNWDQKSIIIHPPVDTDFFSTYARVKHPTQQYIISAGRFVKYKRHDQAIATAWKLGWEIVLAGNGPEKDHLLRQCLDLGVKFRFVESPSRSELAVLLSGATVMIHGGVEDFGILPVESIATGTPVVGIAIGGLVDSINAECGVLVNSYDEFADAVLEASKLDRSGVMAQAQRFSKINFQLRFVKALLARYPVLRDEINPKYVPEHQA